MCEIGRIYRMLKLFLIALAVNASHCAGRRSPTVTPQRPVNQVQSTPESPDNFLQCERPDIVPRRYADERAFRQLLQTFVPIFSLNTSDICLALGPLVRCYRKNGSIGVLPNYEIAFEYVLDSRVVSFVTIGEISFALTANGFLQVLEVNPSTGMVNGMSQRELQFHPTSLKVHNSTVFAFGGGRVYRGNISTTVGTCGQFQGISWLPEVSFNLDCWSSLVLGGWRLCPESGEVQLMRTRSESGQFSDCMSPNSSLSISEHVAFCTWPASALVLQQNGILNFFHVLGEGCEQRRVALPSPIPFWSTPQAITWGQSSLCVLDPSLVLHCYEYEIRSNGSLDISLRLELAGVSAAVFAPFYSNVVCYLTMPGALTCSTITPN